MGQETLLFKSESSDHSKSDSVPLHLYKTITHSKQNRVVSALFTPSNLITGSLDGFIEVWNYKTGKLAETQNQLKDKFMMTDSSVQCLAYTKGFLVTASLKGTIKLFDDNGSLVRKIDSIGMALCLNFSLDGKYILKSNQDGTLAVFGIKSGKLVKEFRGHKSFLNSFTLVKNAVVSGSSDGSVKVTLIASVLIHSFTTR